MNTTTLFPKIKLKYLWQSSKPHEASKDIQCYFCKKKWIKVGGIFYGIDNRQLFYCEKCAIHRYKGEYGFKTLKLAEHRRRRTFDVGYLFLELIIDKYLYISKKEFEYLSEKELDFLRQLHQKKYNAFFSKAVKSKLEEIIEQKDIIDKLMPYIKKIIF